jgi:hypothetical protein
MRDLREQVDRFSDVFAFQIGIGGLSADGKVSQFLYSAVTGNCFSALGITPAAGRLFVPGEGELTRAEPVVVLGYSYWQKRFGGRKDISAKMPCRISVFSPKGCSYVKPI